MTLNTLPLTVDGDGAVRLRTRSDGTKQVRLTNGSLVDLALTLAPAGRLNLDIKLNDGHPADHYCGEYHIETFGVLPREEFAVLRKVHKSEQTLDLPNSTER